MTLRALVLAAALIAAAPTAATAQPRGDSLGPAWQPQPPEGARQVRLSLDAVIQIVRMRTPGKLLDAGLETSAEGRPVYRVRWAAANGRRIDFLVDAHSGAILSGGG